MKKEGNNIPLDDEVSDEQAVKEIRGWQRVLEERMEEIEASKELRGWAGELEKIIRKNDLDKKER